MARIIVIDDDPQFRRMLGITLEKSGYEVRIAESGSKGLEMLRERTADLVVTDLIMPDKEGIETIRDLRSEFPDIKIIAVSGGWRVGSQVNLDTAEQLGAGRSFAKPFDMKVFLDAVRQILGLSGASGDGTDFHVGPPGPGA